MRSLLVRDPSPPKALPAEQTSSSNTSLRRSPTDPKHFSPMTEKICSKYSPRHGLDTLVPSNRRSPCSARDLPLTGSRVHRGHGPTSSVYAHAHHPSVTARDTSSPGRLHDPGPKSRARGNDEHRPTIASSRAAFQSRTPEPQCVAPIRQVLAGSGPSAMRGLSIPTHNNHPISKLYAEDATSPARSTARAGLLGGVAACRRLPDKDPMRTENESSSLLKDLSRHLHQLVARRFGAANINALPLRCLAGYQDMPAIAGPSNRASFPALSLPEPSTPTASRGRYSTSRARAWTRHPFED